MSITFTFRSETIYYLDTTPPWAIYRVFRRRSFHFIYSISIMLHCTPSNTRRNLSVNSCETKSESTKEEPSIPPFRMTIMHYTYTSPPNRAPIQLVDVNWPPRPVVLQSCDIYCYLCPFNVSGKFVQLLLVVVI